MIQYIMNIFCDDIAFIYKKNNYFYGISKQNGKIIISDAVISRQFPGLNHFFFISYTYLTNDMELYKTRVRRSLYIYDVSIECIGSYRGEYKAIQELIFFFDYKISHNIGNADIFTLIVEAYWYELYPTRVFLKKLQALD